MAQGVSTEWLDLFEEYRDLHLEPTDYFSLDKLDHVPRLKFLKGLCWNEVRDWIKHDTTPMSEVPLADLDGPGRLFIGGMNDALNDAALERNRVRAVVSIHPKDLLAWDPDQPSYGLRRFGAPGCAVRYHLLIPLSDDTKENLIDYFPRVQEFVGSHLRAGDNILIHCKSGRSRSVAILVAYLQRKHWETTVRPRNLQHDEARAVLRAYRAGVIEAVQERRRPVVLIMDRFLPLLDLYDLQLIGHPDFEREKKRLFPPDEGVDKKKSAGGGEAVKAVGAVLKLSVAIAFYKHREKPLRSVVQRFFSVRDEYYAELEGLRDEEGGAYDHRGKGHAKPGIVGYYVGFAREYGIAVPEAALTALVKSEGGR